MRPTRPGLWEMTDSVQESRHWREDGLHRYREDGLPAIEDVELDKFELEDFEPGASSLTPTEPGSQ